MRAKTVNFERGKDPKEVLEIGNKNLRDFNHMFKSKQCYSEPMQPMILGLLEGSVKELDAVKFVEKAIIQKVMNKYNGNISHMAKELGLTRTSLYRRLEKYGL